MEMIEVIKYIGIYFLIAFLWLNILATIAIKYDHSLEKEEEGV